MAWYLPDRYPVFWEEVRRRMVGRLLRLSMPPRTLGNAKTVWLQRAIYFTPRILVIFELLLVLTPLLCNDGHTYDADIWHGIMNAQQFLAIMLAPGLALSIFTTERERGSLDFLFLLPISARSLALQKFASACLLPLSVILFLIPYSLVIAVLGHLSPREVLLGYLSLLAHAAFYVAVALLISSLARNTRSAAILAYLGIFLLEYLLPHWFSENFLPLGLDSGMLNDGKMAAFINALLTGPFALLIPNFAYLLCTILALWICTTILNRQRVHRDDHGEARPRVISHVALPNALRWYLPDTHPVLWDDLRRRLRGGRAFSVLLGFVLVLCVTVFGVFTLNAPGGDPQSWPRLGRDLFLAIMIAQGVMVCLLSPALTATTFSSERESRRLDFLFLTGLTTRELVYGKLIGAVAVLLLALISGAPLLAIIAATFGGISPGELTLGYAVVIICGLFGATTAMLSACRMKSSSKALAQGYLTTIGYTLLLVFLTPCFLIVLYMLMIPLAALMNAVPHHPTHSNGMDIFFLLFLLSFSCIGLGIIFTSLRMAITALEKWRRYNREEQPARYRAPLR